MGLIVTWIINAIAVFVSAYILPGVQLSNFLTAMVVAVVLGVVNAIIKPILVLLTLPITVVTFGLFALVINAVMILLVSSVVDGFTVNGFWWALIFSIVLSVVSTILFGLQPK